MARLTRNIANLAASWARAMARAFKRGPGAAASSRSQAPGWRRWVYKGLGAVAGALSLALTGAALGVGFMTWMFAQGPIELRLVKDQIERVVAGSGASVEASSLTLELTSSGAVRLAGSGLDLSAAPRSEGGTGGPGRTRVETASVEFSPRSLAAGRIEPSALELRGGSASLLRQADGTFRLALGEGRPGDDALVLGRAAPGQLSLAERIDQAALRTLLMENVRLHVYDEITGGRRDLFARRLAYSAGREDVFLLADVIEESVGDAVSQDADGAAGARSLARGEDGEFEDAAKLFLHGRWARTRAGGDLVAHIDGVNLGAWAAHLRGEPLVLDAPVRGEARIKASGAAGLEAAAIDLRIEPGLVRLGAIELAVDGGRLAGALDSENGDLAIDTAELFGERVALSASARVSGEAPAWGGEPGALLSAQLAVDRLEVDATPLFQERVSLEEGLFDTSIDLGGEALLIDGMRFRLSGVPFEGSGQLAAKVPRPEGPDGVLIAAELTLSDEPDAPPLTPQLLLKYWPVPFADGGRRFIVKSVEAGEVTEFVGRVEIGAEDLARGHLSDEDMDFRFKGEGLVVRYVSTMTPLTEVKGSGRLRGNSIVAELESGLLGGVTLQSGGLTIPRLVPKGALATYQARGKGPAAAMLALVDEEPLGYISMFGLNPADIEGAGSMDFEMKRPMRVDVPMEDYVFAGAGEFEGVGMNHELLAAKNGRAALRFDSDGLEIEGRAEIAGLPADFRFSHTFFTEEGEEPSHLTLSADVTGGDLNRFGAPVRRFLEGPMGATLEAFGRGLDIRRAEIGLDLDRAALALPTLNFLKPKGEKGGVEAVWERESDGGWRTSFALSGEAMQGSGALRLGQDGVLQAFDLRDVTLGASRQVSVNVFRTPEGVEGAATGEALDVRGFLGAAGATATAPGEEGAPPADAQLWPFPPIGFDLDMGQLILTENGGLDEFEGRFDVSGEGARGEGRFKAAAASGRLEVRPLYADGDFAGHALALSIQDAGALVEAVTGSAALIGGRLRLEGEVGNPASASDAWLLVIEDFTVQNAPFGARILSAASLQGLADLLSGDGLRFSRLEAPMSWASGVLTLDEASAEGSALGFTLRGDVDLTGQRLALDGVLVPLYGVNSALSEAPLLGALLTSREGEGILALTYSISGPFADARVFVNPLSALTPGILRRIFEAPD